MAELSRIQVDQREAGERLTEESVELVQADTVASTENVKSGNEAVRQAIQDKATYRVYILFIILVFSFSLLFLDWYNP